MAERQSGMEPDAVPWSRRVAFNSGGLVPVIAQDAGTRQVLMLAWMDEEALRRTCETGRATYWSRSRQEYWVKGKTSGNIQRVREVRIDCDGDTILLLVDQVGPACHTGAPTCFEDVLGRQSDDSQSRQA